MGNLHNIYYIQINLICILILLVMFFSVHKRKAAQARQRMFIVIVLSSIFMCLSDIFCWCFDGKIMVGAHAIVSIANMIYYATITIACYAWLVYTRSITHGFHGLKRFTFLSSIPLIIMSALILINPLTNFLFTVSQETNVYERGNGVIIHWIISYGYLIFASLNIIFSIKKADTKSRKEELRPLLFFIVWPVIAAICQMLFFGIVATQCGITLSIIVVVLSNLKSEITTDSLTTLNNRAAFDKYIVDNIHNQGRVFTVLMCDIDKFKTINDTMGHAVGDIALKSAAKVLKQSCDLIKANPFLCRFGGDEFVVCVPDVDVSFSEFEECVNKELSRPEFMAAGIVKLSMSFGSSTGLCFDYTDFEKILKESDEKMYKMKQQRKN